MKKTSALGLVSFFTGGIGFHIIKIFRTMMGQRRLIKGNIIMLGERGRERGAFMITCMPGRDSGCALGLE